LKERGNEEGATFHRYQTPRGRGETRGGRCRIPSPPTGGGRKGGGKRKRKKTAGGRSTLSTEVGGGGKKWTQPPPYEGEKAYSRPPLQIKKGKGKRKEGNILLPISKFFSAFLNECFSTLGEGREKEAERTFIWQTPRGGEGGGFQSHLKFPRRKESVNRRGGKGGNPLNFERFRGGKEEGCRI